jgi:hypothetical protein
VKQLLVDLELIIRRNTSWEIAKAEVVPE